MLRLRFWRDLRVCTELWLFARVEGGKTSSGGTFSPSVRVSLAIFRTRASDDMTLEGLNVGESGVGGQVLGGNPADGCLGLGLTPNRPLCEDTGNGSEMAMGDEWGTREGGAQNSAWVTPTLSDEERDEEEEWYMSLSGLNPGGAPYGVDGLFLPMGRRAGERDRSATSPCLPNLKAPLKKRAAEPDLVPGWEVLYTEVIGRSPSREGESS